jgi:hypothetical protein
MNDEVIARILGELDELIDEVTMLYEQYNK